MSSDPRFSNIQNKVLAFKNVTMPQKIKDLSKLDDKLAKYIKKYANDHHSDIVKYITNERKASSIELGKGTKEPDGVDEELKEVIEIYLKLDKNKMYNKVYILGEVLSAIIDDIEKIKQRATHVDRSMMKSIKGDTSTKRYDVKRGGVKRGDRRRYLNINVDENNIRDFYVPPSLIPTINIPVESEIYPNFFIDDMDSLIVNKIAAIKYILESPLMEWDDPNGDYYNHVNFLTTMNLEFGRHRVYRYINRDVLSRIIGLLNKIVREHREFYGRFRVTILTLLRFCRDIYNIIGNNIIDLDAITLPRPELNYGFVMLNNFKILLDEIISIP